MTLNGKRNDVLLRWKRFKHMNENRQRFNTWLLNNFHYGLEASNRDLFHVYYRWSGYYFGACSAKNAMNVVIRKSICAYFCSVVFIW